MGHMGAVQMRYRTMTFSTQRNNQGGTFLETIYIWGKYFFHSFLCIIFTVDTICADNKDKPMAGRKNQLIKSF